MLTSELIAALNKVNQVAGDVPVVLKRIEDDAVTELATIGVHIDPTSGSTSGQVVLEHATPAPAPLAPPAVEPEPVS